MFFFIRSSFSETSARKKIGATMSAAVCGARLFGHAGRRCTPARPLSTVHASSFQNNPSVRLVTFLQRPQIELILVKSVSGRSTLAQLSSVSSYVALSLCFIVIKYF
jgi:hypothetical protein